jgi:hypothetical protein
MLEVLAYNNVVKDVVASYDGLIQSIGASIDAAPLILSEFQESILDTKHEREKNNILLQDILAKNTSLRKKDFSNMMNGILSSQDRREKEVRDLLRDYFNDQKNISQGLRENLRRFKDALVRGEAERVKRFHALIKEILAKQEERKKEVISKLKEFQKEQQEIIKRLKELLAKGRDLRIKDFKSMLKELNTQGKERAARREERRKEVYSMLNDIKKERAEAARKRWAVQDKIA